MALSAPQPSGTPKVDKRTYCQELFIERIFAHTRTTTLAQPLGRNVLLTLRELNGFKVFLHDSSQSKALSLSKGCLYGRSQCCLE